jgi:hypothetical protein
VLRIIEICDVNSEGHKVRLSDGTYMLIPHSQGEVRIDAEISEPIAAKDAENTDAVPE